MLAHMMSGAVLGIDAYPVRVECTLSNGLLKFFVVGLPDNAVKESTHRVTGAIRNSGYDVPGFVYTVNLSPADRRKEGSSFDLPIALSILTSTGRIRPIEHGNLMLVGELTLGGELRPIRGAIVLAVEARRRGMDGLVLPRANAVEAGVVEGLSIFPVDSLREAVTLLESQPGSRKPAQQVPEKHWRPSPLHSLDFADVKGQTSAKRAVEVAAAGGHNLIFIGPPGSGKTMLAKRISGILPGLSFEESLETSKIHSVAGLLSSESGLVHERPFRAPHHTISNAALVGGGPYPRPGEISLAHHGVLFLDELPEFARNVLEVLRQPIEEGRVSISRSRMSIEFPASFMLVCAMNPCPCGHFGDPKHECICTPIQIQRYMGKVSGPLMDRIDLHVEVPAVRFEEMSSRDRGEPSALIRERVMAARSVQESRYHDLPGVFTNAHLESKGIHQFCKVEGAGSLLLKSAIESLGLSARAYDRILKVARTIADLASAEQIQAEHVAEAIQYRSLDRKSFNLH